jgi:hypothetical protein
VGRSCLNIHGGHKQGERRPQTLLTQPTGWTEGVALHRSCTMTYNLLLRRVRGIEGRTNQRPGKLGGKRTKARSTTENKPAEIPGLVCGGSGLEKYYGR